MKTKITWHTIDYEFSHGHKPRGEGQWMFKIRGFKNGNFSEEISEKYDAYGTVGEAKKQVREYCNNSGYNMALVEILS